ncbi:MAG: hypothetical protein NTW29_11985 [Bacteroidetes bacterium]|nr:hypothetical protein [Bacteroidota bacterium]
MTRHIDNDAERIAAFKKTRIYVSVTLYATLLMLAYTLYQLFA